jgi:hypothetical protein
MRTEGPSQYGANGPCETGESDGEFKTARDKTDFKFGERANFGLWWNRFHFLFR